jgi:rhodanese-related sulfurtransferase
MANILRHVDPEKAKDFFAAQLEFVTGPAEVSRLGETNPDDLNIVDVRAEEDFAKGHLPGAVSLPEADWGSLRGLHGDRTNVIYGHSAECILAKRAAIYFAERGFPVKEMLGGYRSWIENGLRSETGGLAKPFR